MEQLRRFPDEAEVIGRAWRQEAKSRTSWSADGTPGHLGGQASGYRVTSGTVNAFAKPSVVGPENPQIPRAAHEKIAADLAHEMGLPIPPVILHTWHAIPCGNQAHVALSLWPFSVVHKWQHIESLPDVCVVAKAKVRQIASALVAFDTWLDNRDRANAGNLLVSGADDGSLAVAYIDYSYSMVYGWRGSVEAYKSINPCVPYPIDQASVDRGMLRQSMIEISNMSDEVISSIVNRVPGEFLQEDDRGLILEGLLYRKSAIQAPLRDLYGVTS